MGCWDYVWEAIIGRKLGAFIGILNKLWGSWKFGGVVKEWDGQYWVTFLLKFPSFVNYIGDTLLLCLEKLKDSLNGRFWTILDIGSDTAGVRFAYSRDCKDMLCCSILDSWLSYLCRIAINKTPISWISATTS